MLFAKGNITKRSKGVGSLMSDDYARLWRPWTSMPKDIGVLNVFAVQ